MRIFNTEEVIFILDFAFTLVLSSSEGLTVILLLYFYCTVQYFFSMEEKLVTRITNTQVIHFFFHGYNEHLQSDEPLKLSPA